MRGLIVLAPLAIVACVQDWSRPWRDAAVDVSPADVVHPDREPPPPAAWVTVPNGVYAMGSVESEPCRQGNEPRHNVAVTRRFELMGTEVGRADFQQALGYQPSPSGCAMDTCPVSNTSWHDAAAYCNTLSTRAGLEECYTCSGSPAHCEVPKERSGHGILACSGYRLPTDAEWERAYRAGTTSSLPSGPLDVCTGTSAASDGYAWYQANSGDHPHPRATRLPNAWGLRDLGGNVAEWTHDGPATTVDDPAMDPVGPDQGMYDSRALRGGSYASQPRELRAAAVRLQLPDLPTAEVGFRCARTLPVAQQLVLAEVFLPSQTHPASEYALDLDGRGPKNLLGEVIASAMSVGIDLGLNYQIADGGLLHLFELSGTSIVDQPSATLQSFQARDTDDDHHNFGGEAVLALDPATSFDALLSGPLQSGRLQASGTLLLPIPVIRPQDPIVTVLLKRARADLRFYGISVLGRIGGALPMDAFEQKVLPQIAGAFTWLLDPKNLAVTPEQRKAISDTLDTNRDGIISLDELKNNSLARAIKPDIDTDGDGTPDAYSIGVGVKLVPCKIQR